MSAPQNHSGPLTVIARIRTLLPEKFGVPRQSGLIESLKGVIVFEKPFRNANALRGLDNFSHLWLIWGFSEAVQAGWSALVRPPRCGGNIKIGVFASRSPFRPNPLGLSCVRIEEIETDSELGPQIHVSGVDLIDNSPIYDLKPYLPYTDSHPEAKDHFSKLLSERKLSVNITAELLNLIPTSDQPALIDILSHDPRPAYQQDSGRIYGLRFASYNIRFKIYGTELTVYEITEQPER